MRRYKSQNRKTSIILIIGGAALVLAAALLFLARKWTGFAQWYSENIYDFLVSTVGRFFGVFPFSVSEILLYLIIGGVIFSVARIVIRLIRRKAGKKEAAGIAAGFFCMAAVLLLVYTVNCGINYHKVSFAESAGIEAGDYTVAQLEEVCRILTEEVNTQAELVSRGEDGAMVFSSDTAEVALKAMYGLAEDFGSLEGFYPQPKGLIFPWILSVQKITGIYSPFTIEANYNDAMTDYNIPFTACHELSHLRGFMQEEEANFIAWLACRESDNPEFRYSGSLRGWISCTNALYRADYDAWAKIRVQLSPLAEADLDANRAFWAQYEGKISDTAEKVNDTYLKANGQSDGIRSYGRMADLIVAWVKETTE